MWSFFSVVLHILVVIFFLSPFLFKCTLPQLVLPLLILKTISMLSAKIHVQLYLILAEQCS